MSYDEIGSELPIGGSLPLLISLRGGVIVDRVPISLYEGFLFHYKEIYQK
jgi:hypothetical protein